MNFSYLLQPLQQPELIGLLALGVFLGIYVGAIPGLSATMAISLLVSVTYGWDIYASISLMTGVYVGAVYGGSRSAILLNIPGAPAAVATGLDGYPLTLKGQAGRAMAAAAAQSVVGTLIGAAVLLFLAPALSRLARDFRSVDYLLLGIMGLLTVGSLGCKSLRKGIFSAALGLFIGCIGMDRMTPVKRFTFGIPYLSSGINFIVALIGLFGVSEALASVGRIERRELPKEAKRILPSLKEFAHHLPLTLLSSAIGVFTGALPGAGGDIAALFAYDSARRTVKHPSAPFGEGAIEGVIAPETANNAAIGGAFIPMLTLGIPGDSVTAIYISALMLAGLEPGPGFLTGQPDIFMLIVAGLAIAAVFMLIFSLTGIRLFARLARIPAPALVPAVLLISAIGAYAVNFQMTDVAVMFLFGLIGWALKRREYPMGPMVLGIVLEPMLEDNLRRTLMLNNGSPASVFADVFRSPITVILFAFVLLLPLGGYFMKKRPRRGGEDR